MNFVDVQPKSFLDYAWTTPSDTSSNPAKPSKTSRKQNRCCDQCRKGKRACDAAILEDTLLDKHGSNGSNPTVFHYSDVFGPLAPCSNCEKTKKSCTFEWLRSQRVSHSAPQAGVAAPPAKRRRKSNSSTAPQSQAEATQQSKSVAAPPTAVPDIATTNGGDFVPPCGSDGFGLTFADFALPTYNFSAVPFSGAPFRSHVARSVSQEDAKFLSEIQEDEAESDDPVDRDSGKGSSLDTPSEGRTESMASESPATHDSSSVHSNTSVVRMPRKRRRRSSIGKHSDRIQNPMQALTNQLVLSSNNTFLTEGLLRIYHDSFENALSCWLTERTCPYSKDSDVSLANDAGPNWNRVYHRVFRLDRIASSIRGKVLGSKEDKAASRAINLAVISFATQWAQSSQRSRAKYPFHSDGLDNRNSVFSADDGFELSSMYKDFDRNLQVSAWHEAREALQDAREIESFRVVLAHIVFSLTQRPTELDAETLPAGEERASVPTDSSSAAVMDDVTMTSDAAIQPAKDAVDECEELLSKLDIAIEGDGPPVYLEQGLRLIHSLRSRMAISGAMNKKPRYSRSTKPNFNRLDAADRATVDLLFWLGIMFDTVSSAMHKRPLVVPDEDSDIYSNDPRPALDTSQTQGDAPPQTVALFDKSEGLWDGYLFARQRERLQATSVRWPCSYEQAASLLCDAAPVKVLLFRKVTRIQTLLSRNIRGERIEAAVKAAFDVHNHWVHLYAPFIRDCIEYHDSLPPRVQSWYICLTGHWHLAALLLADLVEIIDDAELSVESQRRGRITNNFIHAFRETNCHTLSDLAQCACPRDGASFAKSNEFHFAVSQGALLTEPWTAVLIRAFAKAGVALLESESSVVPGVPDVVHQEGSFRRADDCVKALWYLGRKSDMALTAARILGDALKQRRKGAEEKLNDMSSFLRAELWEGYDEMNDTFAVDCVH